MTKKSIVASIIISTTILSAGAVATVIGVAAAGLNPLTAEASESHCEFLNYDQSFLYSCSVPRGKTAVYDGPTPTKPQDQTYSYRFKGWDNSLDRITSDTTFIAQYDAEIRQYSASFVNYDNTILFQSLFPAGETPFYSGGVPAKPHDQVYNYVFKGWDKPFEPMTKNVVYTATFDPVPIAYAVQFQNEDGTFLYEDHVGYNGTAIYAGPTPSKASDERHTYLFSGWDTPLTGIVADTIIVAQYQTLDISYVVTFRNYDASILYVDHVAALGAASYQGSVPTKPSDQYHVFTFNGWDKPFDSVTSNLDITAQFSESTPTFTVTFKNYDGSVLGSDTVAIGETAVYDGPTPTKPEDDAHTYSFKGWDRSLDAVNKDYYTVALFTSTLKEFVVTFCNWDKTELQKVTVTYGSPAEYSAAAPTRADDDTYTYTFKGWNEDISCITKAITTYAEFTPEPIKKSSGEGGGGSGPGTGGGGGVPTEGDLLTVVFDNWDNTFLDADDVPRGQKAYYDSETPTRKADAKHKLYTFQSFDKGLTNVQKSFATYAQYTIDDDPINPYYIVTFRNDDDALLYEDVLLSGEMPAYRLNQAPVSSKPGTWVFKGWDRALVSATKSYTVYPVYEMAEGPSVSGPGNDPGGISGSPSDLPDTPIFTYSSTTAGAVHFREQSLGPLSANHWGKAPAYTIPSTGINPIYFTDKKIEATNPNTSTLTLTYEKAHVYALLPDYSQTYLSAPSGEAACGPAVDLKASYSYVPNTLDATAITSLAQTAFTDPNLTAQEADYQSFVTTNYLGMDDTEAAFFTSFIADNHLKADTLSDILACQDFIKGYATYNAKFTAYPTGSDYVLYFLQTAKEGICNHFASALTLLLRALKVPARFVTGYYASGERGASVEVKGKNAHAWTEAYIKGLGWVALDATPGGTGEDPGTGGDDTPFGDFDKNLADPIVISGAASVTSKVYDGTAVSYSGSYTGTLDAGDTIDYGFSKAERDVGFYNVRFSPRILDAAGNDVSDHYKNRVQIIYGQYEITPLTLTIQTGSATKVRDGTPLTCLDYQIVSGEFASGESIHAISIIGSQTDPGSSLNDVDALGLQIFDAEGNDTTANYVVKWLLGTLVVTL
jgi:transglutaminase-like putative cysteine protease